MKADSSVVTYVYESDSYGGKHSPNIGVLHDVESPLKAGYARSLIGPAWFGGPAPTSTHYIVDPVDICQGVPEDNIAWHCGTGNPRSIAIEQAGYARFSKSEWTTPDGLKQRYNVARLMADINKRRPLIRLKWLTDAELRYAFNNPGTPGGWTTHDRMRAVIGGTTHYDPQNAPNASTAYPLSELMAEAVAIRGGETPNTGSPIDEWLKTVDDQKFKDLVRQAVDWWMTDTVSSRPVLLKKAAEDAIAAAIPTIVEQVANQVMSYGLVSEVDGNVYAHHQFITATNGRVYSLPQSFPEPDAPKD